MSRLGCTLCGRCLAKGAGHWQRCSPSLNVAIGTVCMHAELLRLHEVANESCIIIITIVILTIISRAIIINAIIIIIVLVIDHLHSRTQPGMRGCLHCLQARHAWCRKAHAASTGKQAAM